MRTLIARRGLFALVVVSAAGAILISQTADGLNCPCGFPIAPGINIQHCDANCTSSAYECCSCGLISSQCRCCPPGWTCPGTPAAYGIGRVDCTPPPPEPPGEDD
jgi:hypothetical protein